MLNPIFWKKVQGQRHPGRWDIAERKIPSVKMLFKTNTNGHKHPSISLLIIEQDTIGKTKENNKWHSTQEPRTPKNRPPLACDGVQLHQYWTTPPAYVYIQFLDENICHQEEAHRPTHRFRRLFIDLLLIWWIGCASAMGVIKRYDTQTIHRHKHACQLKYLFSVCLTVCISLFLIVISYSDLIKDKKYPGSIWNHGPVVPGKYANVLMKSTPTSSIIFQINYLVRWRLHFDEAEKLICHIWILNLLQWWCQNLENIAQSLYVAELVD